VEELRGLAVEVGLAGELVSEHGRGLDVGVDGAVGLEGKRAVRLVGNGG